MKTVIFSDVHLDAAEPRRGTPQATARSEFIAFLDGLGAKGVARVIILGDLFDFWFEYKHVVFSGYFDVLRALARLHEAGVELHLICGNHDFWAGRFLEGDLGFTVHRKPVVLDFAGRRVLLVHGDGLNRRDWGYRLYKRVARAGPVIWLFGLLHPDLAMGLARRVSKTSRRLFEATDPTKGSEAKALRAFAQETIQNGDADVVVCGHAHAPTYEEFAGLNGPGLYINAGDWMFHRSYVEWDGEGFRLRRADEGVRG